MVETVIGELRLLVRPDAARIGDDGPNVVRGLLAVGKTVVLSLDPGVLALLPMRSGRGIGIQLAQRDKAG